MKSFQIVLLGIFAGIAILGIVFFATTGGFGGGDKVNVGQVDIWGTLDAQSMNNLLEKLKGLNDGFDGVTYTELDSRTYYQDIVEALASGRSPDLIMLGEDDIVRFGDKIIPIPFDNYSERTFKRTFIDEGELFLSAEGIYALPFTIDPLVMYWNRSIFSSASIANPPTEWEELYLMAPEITKADGAGNVIKSAVALGEYDNITNAQELLSALIFQAGDPITTRGTEGVEVTLGNTGNDGTSPAESALRFYTEFSNPIKTVYSWNRAMKNDRQSFLAGDLALYFGFGSELPLIKAGNPNLSFDVAELPQPSSNSGRATYGKMQAFALSRNTDNPSGAFQTAVLLTGEEALKIFAQTSTLAPARRSLLGEDSGDAARSTIYDSALIGQSWIDPNPAQTAKIFEAMIESVTTGKARLREALVAARNALEELFR